MSVIMYRREAAKRFAAFIGAMEDSRKPLHVVATDEESRKDALDTIKLWTSEILHSVFLIDHDLKVANTTLQLLEDSGIDVAAFMQRALQNNEITDEEQAVIYARAHKEAEEREKRERAEEKAGAKRGEVPGQLKAFEPSKMVSAEAAGPVVVSRFVEPPIL